MRIALIATALCSAVLTQEQKLKIEETVVDTSNQDSRPAAGFCSGMTYRNSAAMS